MGLMFQLLILLSVSVASSFACRSVATPRTFATTQSKSKWNFGWFNSSKSTSATSDGQEFDDPTVRSRFQERIKPKLEGSIFEDEVSESKVSDQKASPTANVPLSAENTAYSLDPDPRSRVRWERKKVIQMVRRNGRVNRAERIARTERELLHRSEYMPTSVKKLVHLARQIQGKTLDDALVQMQYSKKKMAAEVKYHLEDARDLAVVTRGMSLGKVTEESALQKPINIQTKDGKSLAISDPTRLYIAQAWVGRGPIRSKEYDYKGRGRHGVIEHPSTSKCPKYLHLPTVHHHTLMSISNYS
jgi:ribosomal protein L22